MNQTAVTETHGATPGMGERPRRRRGELLIVWGIACAIALALTGRQIYSAAWGMIDDHEVFSYLAGRSRLPFTEIWHTLMTKTEVGTLAGRYRPTFYLLKVSETWLFGNNVHLWYLTVSGCFAIILASIGSFARRFVGVWAAGILTLYVAMLPLWSGIWSRLGPSEIYGAACVGLMIFATEIILFSDKASRRNLGGVLLAVSTVLLIGMKETFVPIAGGAFAVLLLAVIERKLSVLASLLLALVILLPLAGIVLVVKKQVGASGTDFYAQSIGVSSVLSFALRGLLSAILSSGWIVLLPIVIFSRLEATGQRPLWDWLRPALLAVGAWALLVVTYALQCALYRSHFPMNLRYDFPAMLLVPLSLVIAACYVAYMLRRFYSNRFVDNAALAAGAVLLVAIESNALAREVQLSAMVNANIAKTRAFYGAVSGAAEAARRSPEAPVILDALGAGAYEPVYSLRTYLVGLGVQNPISIRLRPDAISYGPLYDNLQAALAGMEKNGGEGFTPLQANLARPHQGCVSIGINMPANADCAGFVVSTQ
ncbi:hypothetical protein IC762_05160 [Bradyrhizobium genosp. L]|uniref:hypothetical protein n=1 Tax=Bradyrhizobium genosp. L TaxID=83637 RepID=UPI0018A2FC50|nr:hypothetical protein [Bradyrhizobium genosp. L]QPF85701.1 hypothetical protein IC762_05160 [Bradyrhizobium genosp. L]